LEIGKYVSDESGMVSKEMCFDRVVFLLDGGVKKILPLFLNGIV